VRHDFPAFVEYELKLREEAGYPPFSELVRILVSHPDEVRTEAAARRAIETLRPAASEFDVQILGPAPCPIRRVRGRARFQILLKCTDRGAMRQVVRFAYRKVTSSHPVRVTLDVDPVSLM
jgi:primosomal protein N' (replication factor Y)